MIIRAVLLLLLIVFCASFFVRPSSAQEVMYCFNNFNEAREKAQEHDEKFIWSGFNLLGIEMFFFDGDKTWTVFIKSDTGLYCTSPALIGVKTPKGVQTRYRKSLQNFMLKS